MMNEEIIRTIEEKVDNMQSNKEIWNNSRSELIYNALTCFEDISRLGAPISFITGEDVNALLNLNADAIDMLIRWIFEYSKSDNMEFKNEVQPSIYIELGILMKDDALKYRIICDSYTLWSRNKAQVKLYKNNKGVEFDYLKDSNGKIEVYDLIRGNEKKNGFLNEMRIKPEEFKAIDNIIKSIEVKEEKHIDYTINYSDWKCIHNELSKRTEINWVLPSEWKLGEFTLGEFRIFWNMIRAKAYIHSIVCMKSGVSGGAVNDCVIVVSPDEIVRLVKKYTSLEEVTIKALVKFLTYNEECYKKNVDVIWSPFIELNNRLLAISPNLVLTSNPERNLISLINKVNSKAYSNLSVQKEKIMVDNIEEEICVYSNIIFRKNRPLPDRLPDMDIVIFDTESSSLLICEAKWLLETDSISEVCERDKDIQKGLRQAEDIQSYAEKNIEDLLNRAYGKNDYRPKTIYTCVVTKNNIGTSKLNIGRAMVIDKEKLCEIIKNNNGNIQKTIKEIKNGAYLNDIKVNYRIEKREIQYGEYFFKFDACEMLNDDNSQDKLLNRNSFLAGDQELNYSRSNDKERKIKKKNRKMHKSSRKRNRK